MLLSLLLATLTAQAEPGGMPQVVPVAELGLDWQLGDRWLVSPVRTTDDGGTRVGVLATADGPARFEARGVDEAGVPGPWIDADEVWRGGDGQVVHTAELGQWWPAAQVRALATADLVELGWDLHLPVFEPTSATPDPRPPSVPSALEDIGVVSRESWGADATSCTTLEDDWYRFAIHHTAGNTTSGGTVQGAVQALQAYAMSSGSFCDIPYQFLVGQDGSLWEGRPYGYYSGATGGGNNDGNFAVCYLGCFDSTYCGDDGGDDDSLIMMAAGRLLVQTLATMHGITTTSETLKGHRDWPDNSTACPGDKIHARVDELMSTTAHIQASLVATAWDGQASVQVEEGATEVGWVQLRNDGLETWTSNTVLAPLPRDTAHDLAAGAWVSTSRVSGPETDVGPGELGTFPVEVYGAAVGTHSLSLTLVEEWVSWLADPPIGGGWEDGDVVLSVEVVASGGGTDGGADDSGGDAGTTDDGGVAWGDTGGTAGSGLLPPPGQLVGGEQLGGCGCASSAAPVGLVWWLGTVLGLALRRR